MDHQTALSSKAAERYTLGELNSPERESFEEHFFTCSDCTDALRDYEVFIANTRAVFKEDSIPNPVPIKAVQTAQPGWWKNWFAIPAVAFAGLLLAFVMLRDPGLPDPNAPQVEWDLRADSRAGTIPRFILPANAKWAAPQINLLGLDPNRWASYHWEVRGDDGDVIGQGDGHGAENPLRLKIPATRFKSNETYKLTVQGDPTTGPLVSSFIVDRK